MSVINKETVRRVNDAFARNDTDAFLAWCTDDVRWIMTGEWILSGKEVIRKFLADMDTGKAPVITLTNIIAEGDLAVGDGLMNMPKKNGEPYEAAFCDIYRFRDGQIAELTSYVIELKKQS